MIPEATMKGDTQEKRTRSSYTGMMLHQDGSRHQWVARKYWDLIVTMDDASSEHYSMFFVEEEGTQSSFRGIKEVIEQHDGVWAEDDDNSNQPIRRVRNARHFFKSYSSTRKLFIPSDYSPK